MVADCLGGLPEVALELKEGWAVGRCHGCDARKEMKPSEGQPGGDEVGGDREDGRVNCNDVIWLKRRESVAGISKLTFLFHQKVA